MKEKEKPQEERREKKRTHLEYESLQGVLRMIRNLSRKNRIAIYLEVKGNL
jgi:hypothetical protein